MGKVGATWIIVEHVGLHTVTITCRRMLPIWPYSSSTYHMLWHRLHGYDLIGVPHTSSLRPSFRLQGQNPAWHPSC